MKIFPYETIASNEEFLGREDELKTINEFIINSKNLVVFSKRRLGKSSLINEAIFRLEKSKKNILIISVDVYDITSAEDFATILLQGLTSSYKGDIATSIKKLGSMFKRTRVEPTFDANTGNMSIKPVVTALKFEELLEDFFETVYVLAKDRKVVIAIDEFQEISTIKDKKIDALFRKYVQDERSSNISFIFLGSKRHILTSLFEYNAPLYEMATPFELTCLEVEDIYNYVKKHLDVNMEIIKYIFNLCNGETKLMQHILFLLHTRYKDTLINEEKVEKVLEEILKYKQSSYRVLLDTFTVNQKKALKIILKYEKGFFKQEVLNEQALSKSVLQAAINTLINREILDKSDDVFFIPDRALELWGKRYYK